jgi:hypothetical protein
VAEEWMGTQLFGIPPEACAKIQHVAIESARPKSRRPAT